MQHIREHPNVKVFGYPLSACGTRRTKNFPFTTNAMRRQVVVYSHKGPNAKKVYTRIRKNNNLRGVWRAPRPELCVYQAMLQHRKAYEEPKKSFAKFHSQVNCHSGRAPCGRICLRPGIKCHKRLVVKRKRSVKRSSRH